MQRVRYRGLFQAKGRQARLQICRGLIAIAQGLPPPIAADDESRASQDTNVKQKETLETDEPEEPPRPPETPKRCRYCQGETAIIGGLSGNQTLRLLALVRVISGLFGLLPILGRQPIEDLIEQLRGETPDYRGLPPEIANNLKRQPLIGFETAAIIALLHAQLATLTKTPNLATTGHVTGIPPPEFDLQHRQTA